MTPFPCIRIEGVLFAADFLERALKSESGDLGGQQPKDFGLGSKHQLTEEMSNIFANACEQWRIFQHRLK